MDGAVQLTRHMTPGQPETALRLLMKGKMIQENIFYLIFQMYAVMRS